MHGDDDRLREVVPAFSTAPATVRVGTWEDLQRAIDTEAFMANPQVLVVSHASMGDIASMLRDARDAFAAAIRIEPAVLVIDGAGYPPATDDIDHIRAAQASTPGAPHVFVVAGHDTALVRTPDASSWPYWDRSRPARHFIVEDDTGLFGTFALASHGLESAGTLLRDLGASLSTARIYIFDDDGEHPDAPDWNGFLSALAGILTRPVTVMAYPEAHEQMAYVGVHLLVDGGVLLEVTPRERGTRWAQRLVDTYGCESATAAYVNPPSTVSEYEALLESSRVAWVVKRG